MADFDGSRFAFEPRRGDRGMAFPTGRFQVESQEGYKTPCVSGGVSMYLDDRSSIEASGGYQRSDFKEDPSPFSATLTYRRAF